MNIGVSLIEVAGFASALQALHLPFGKPCNSNVQADFTYNKDCGVLYTTSAVLISPGDEKLLKRLVKAGDEHSKVLRGVVAYLRINAPRFWWQEFDTYRVGCERLASESTMHIQGRGLTEAELVRMKSKLPEGTMQERIVMVSYQTLRRIYMQRRNHRLPHWREFCQWIACLPYSWLIV